MAKLEICHSKNKLIFDGGHLVSRYGLTLYVFNDGGVVYFGPLGILSFHRDQFEIIVWKDGHTILDKVSGESLTTCPVEDGSRNFKVKWASRPRKQIPLDPLRVQQIKYRLAGHPNDQLPRELAAEIRREIQGFDSANQGEVA